MDGKRWWPCVAGLAAAAAIAALSGCGGPDTSRSATAASPATPLASSSASPSPGATPEPSPALWGEFPAPVLPASAIPWDQVGPGWFLLAYDSNSTDEINAPPQQVGTIDDTLTLVSPEGALYHALDLTGKGDGSLIGWGNQGLLVLDQNATGFEPVLQHGRVDAIDLVTGVSTGLIADAHKTGGIRVLEDGRTVMWTMASGFSGFDVDLRDGNLDVDMRLCADGEHSGSVSELAPDGNRAVCLLPRASDGKTDVVLVALDDGSHTPLDVLTYDYQEYWTDGWWDANSVIVQRVEYGPTEEEDAVLSWVYDVAARKIRDLDARMADGTSASRAYGLGGYRVVSSGRLFEAHSLEGVLLAALPCEPEAVSGHMVLAQCETSAGATAIEVTNLETGATTVVAEFVLQKGDRNAVFPAPGGARHYFFWQ